MYHLMNPIGERRLVHPIFASSIDEAKHLASIHFGVGKDLLECRVRSRTPFSDKVIDHFERKA